MSSPKDFVKTRGDLHFHLRNGKDKDQKWDEKNLVLNLGIGSIAKRLISDGEAKVSHMALGTGNTAAAPADAALGAEVARVAIQGAIRITEVVTNDSIQYTAEFPAGVATGALTEAGLFSADNIWSRTVFGTFTKEPDDVLTIAWVIRFGA